MARKLDKYKRSQELNVGRDALLYVEFPTHYGHSSVYLSAYVGETV